MKIHIILIPLFLAGCESNKDPQPQPCDKIIIRQIDIKGFCFNKGYKMGKDYVIESNKLESILMGGAYITQQRF